MSQDLYSDNFSGTLDTAHVRMVKARKLKSETTAKIYSIINELFGIPCDTKPIEFSPVFKFYTDEEQSNSLFKNIFEKLNASKGTINKNDCWNFYDLMEIITNNKISPSRKDLKFLITECKIPERHIHHKYKYFDHGFDNIWLSRYSAYLMISTAANKIIRDSNGFTYEKMAFARSYFAFADCELSDLIQPTWDFIRGEKLKTISDIFQARIGNLIKLFNGRVFYFEVRDLLHNHIFDTLFATAYKPNELQSFEKIYKQVIKNSKTNSPIPYIAPHIMIFLSEQIDKFCDYIYKSIKEDATFVGSNKLDALAAKFFIQTRYQLELSKRADKNIDSLFNKKSLFSEYHQSVSFENINSIEKGNGRSHIDNWGIKFRDTEGISFYRDQHLFSNDEIWVMEVKKSYENNLINIYHDISTKKKTAPECADKIKELKQKITSENMNLYGIDIPEFLNIQLSSGNLFSKQLSLDLFNENKSDNSSNIEQTYEIKPVNLNKHSLPDFEIMPETSIIIPRGIPFAATDTGKRYYSKVGEFESINPLVPNPPLLSKSGEPSPADANFGFCSFLYEMDHLSLEDQVNLAKHLVSLNVINRIVFSGNKSLHMRCTIKDVPNNKSEYRWLFFYLAEKYNLVSKKYDTKKKEFIYTSNILDFSCSNNGRATRRPDIVRPDTNKLQKLVHQTNNILDIDWRPAYQEYLQKQKQREEELAAFRASFANHTGPNLKLIEKVKWLLIDWHDGNRHNLLNMGLIPMMWYAGWTEHEIKSVLEEDGNRNLNATIEKYISNLQKQYA
ncbi:MAG TPA: hypothetical protein PKJ33_03385 [Alphaproteobacteria bacterium]|nr:hypothetical protein [Alphaproteobacteria bacterium]